MKAIRVLMLLAVSCFLLASCVSYEKTVRDELKIPYVFIPPNDANHPYTLFQYTKEGNFQPICLTTILTGLTEDQIKSQRKVNTCASFAIKKTHNAEYSVKLSEEELGALSAKYKGVSKVEISFDNGKVYTLPGVFLSDVVDRIKTTKCAADVKLIYSEQPDSKFLLPLVVYGYDLKYHIYKEDGTDVTAELPKELTTIVLAQIGLSYSQTSDITMAGNDMYVGFRGTPIEASIQSILEDSTQKVLAIMQLIEKGQKTIYLLDMTDIVRQVAKEQ